MTRRQAIKHRNIAEFRGIIVEGYVEHRHELLDHHDQFLAEIDLTRLNRMRRETKRRWIHHLDIAKWAWEVEREQKNKHQQKC